jgi:hypothetical protein
MANKVQEVYELNQKKKLWCSLQGDNQFMREQQKQALITGLYEVHSRLGNSNLHWHIVAENTEVNHSCRWIDTFLRKEQSQVQDEHHVMLLKHHGRLPYLNLTRRLEIWEFLASTLNLICLRVAVIKFQIWDCSQGNMTRIWLPKM